ncbi:thioredoxin family protein [Formosa sediminum]|uniref:Thioredoxin family protein n=1 Tax=Formosa sediminum TaxID=2594004 RepID=A0A516GSU4_9FLAO|nr:thioredoxin family protein [Formosa sediminum]QDO94593.1 thioredoxin family protein [Formosa sediminum]
MSHVIKILGTGCPKCQAMTGIVKDVIAEQHIDATVEKIENIEDIIRYNVMSTPALVINEVITIKGRVPSKNEVIALLK